MILHYMTPEQIKEYPSLAKASKFCQDFSKSHKGGCNGCNFMVAGCQNIVNDVVNKEKVFALWEKNENQSSRSIQT